MGKYAWHLLLTIGALSVWYPESSAQESLNQWRIKEVHFSSKVGWGFPLGRTGDVLTPKYSSSMGLDISLMDKYFFLNPFLDFLAYDYDQVLEDPEFAYRLEHGKGGIFALNLTGCMRTRQKNWGVFAYAGTSLSVVTEPRATVDSPNELVKLSNTRTWGPALRAGAGVDYKLGNVYLFLESGYLLHGSKVQNRPIQVISLYGGLR